MFHLDLQMTTNTAASFFLFFFASFFLKGICKQEAKKKKSHNEQFDCGVWEESVNMDAKIYVVV